MDLNITDPDIYQQANELYANLRRNFGSTHTYREVSSSRFRRMNKKFYDESQSILEPLGFRAIADLEDETASRIYPLVLTIYRWFAHSDGVVTAACSQIRANGFFRFMLFSNRLHRDSYNVEFESEFDDGTFVNTLKTTAQVYDPEPGFKLTKLDPETPIEEVLRIHRESVARHQAERPGISPVNFSTLDDILASQHRLRTLRNRHRQQMGYVSEEEFLRTYWPHRQEEGKVVFAKMQQIHDRMGDAWDQAD